MAGASASAVNTCILSSRGFPGVTNYWTTTRAHVARLRTYTHDEEVCSWPWSSTHGHGARLLAQARQLTSIMLQLQQPVMTHVAQWALQCIARVYYSHLIVIIWCIAFGRSPDNASSLLSRPGLSGHCKSHRWGGSGRRMVLRREGLPVPLEGQPRDEHRGRTHEKIGV